MAHLKTYHITVPDECELDLRFKYHPPREDQIERYVGLRESAKAFSRMILKFTPPSREQSLALKSLEEAVMWSNAAIARREYSGDAESDDQGT